MKTLLHSEMEEFLNQVKKVRDLQKRYYYSKAKNEMQQEYKRKLLHECKRQEQALDSLIEIIEDTQVELDL